MFRYLPGFLLLLFIASCRPEILPPKPPGYFKIDTPAAHQYKIFDEPGFPYSFEYPVYGKIEQDTIFQKGATRHPYWININFPSMNGVINITYLEISKQKPLDSLLSDAWGLSFFHHEKAEGIDQYPFDNGHHVTGLLYVVGGNTASRYQFFATDSIRHFLRGSLYFDVTPNADSLKPATDFLETDIKHLLFTLRWK
jgi:gliding motility-associated lipoprotein GldD